MAIKYGLQCSTIINTGTYHVYNKNQNPLYDYVTVIVYHF